MPNHTARILIVDDEFNQRSALASVVTHWGYQAETASDGAEALLKLKDFDADVVITDLNMPNLDGRGLLEELRKLPLPPPAIVLTAFGNLETALETVHELGAFWFIEKPLQPQVLKMVVERALDRRRLAIHAGRLERELASRGVLGDLVGESAVMREIFVLLQQAAPQAQFLWNNKQVVPVYVPQQREPWAAVQTKKLDAVWLTLSGPKGRFALGRITALGCDPQLDGERPEADLIRLKFRSTEDLEQGDLAGFLQEHVESLKR